jgi:ESF2/ABP1 family protein
MSSDDDLDEIDKLQGLASDVDEGSDTLSPSKKRKRDRAQDHAGSPNERQKEKEKDNEKPRKLKVLSAKDVRRSNEAIAQSGVIYMSRVPSSMRPQKVRELLSQFGEVERIYLAPEDRNKDPEQKKPKKRKKGWIKYAEGWVEFKDKKMAKLAAEALNTMIIGEFIHVVLGGWLIRRRTQRNSVS